MTKLQTTLIIALLLCQAPAYAGEDSPDWNADTLTGDWGGTRTSLFRKGVEIGITHKSDVLSNVKGGLENGTEWIGHTEARLSLDLEKMMGWDATTAYFDFHSDLGSKFNTNNVGAFMGVDNVEVGRNTAQFYHAWVEKSFFKGGLAIKAGLYPIDSEFYVTDTSGLFIAPPYGMSNEVAQTDTPAIFPIGALGLRVKLTSPEQNFYAMAAVLDGVAGDPGNPRHTQVTLADGDGTMSIMEIGYTPQLQDENAAGEAEHFNKTALGVWRYTRNTDALDGSGSDQAQGIYVLAERTLFHEQGSRSQGLAGFLRYGTATESIHQVDWTASAGLRYRGLIAGRDDDVAGLAVTVNHAGDDFRDVSRTAGEPTTESSETDWELTYRAQIRPWFALQPNVQYIRQPNMDKTIDDVLVIGCRAELEL